MIKKILTGILTASMLASFAIIPASADYIDCQYDKEYYNINYNDDGTETNAIDGTKALNTDGDDYTELYTGTFNTTQGFYVSFDFSVDEANQDTFLIELPQYKSDHSKIDKVGPIISYGVESSKGTVKQLRTQTGSSAWQHLGDITFGEWYTAEIEGRTGIGTQATVFRLYDSKHQLVQETKNFNMRNISSNNLSFNTMQVKNVNIDNVRLIAENPDTIVISSVSDVLKAGQALSLDYTMLKNGKEFTKHDVEWSVTGSDEVAIDNGVLTADIAASDQTVTVTAQATFNDNVLSATKDITIEAVNTSAEPFDAATVSGPDTVKAGTTSEFTISATKGGVPVELTDADVVWSVYNYNNTFPYYDESYNGQKVIDIKDGKLTVADNVVPQTVTLRASTPSGNVFGYTTVNIDWSASQAETIVVNNSYDTESTAPTGVNKAVGADGSIAYYTPSFMEAKFGNQDGYTLTELDIKFTQEGAGYVLRRNDLAKYDTSIIYKNGNISTNKAALVTGAALNEWYHLEILYSVGNASCNIYKYNDDGTLGEAQKFLDIDRQNDAQYGAYRLEAGTVIDNLKISKPLPNEISLTASKTNVFVGESLTVTPTVSRNGLPLDSTEGVTYSVLDSIGKPIIDGSVTVNDKGEVNVSSFATAQVITVRAQSASGAIADCEVNVQSADMFTITNIGINEEHETDPRIVKLYVTKELNYNDSVAFLIAVYDENNILRGNTIINRFGDTLSMGENELTLDYKLPAGFDPNTWKINVMAWTALS